MSDLALSVDNSNNGGGNETQTIYHDTDALYMYVNNWDVDVDIDVEGTYREDKSFNDSISLTSNKTVSNGTSGSDLLTEPWELLQVTVKPASDPTSGTFELRVMSE